MTLEDLTVYVAERADKERESAIRQLSAPVDGVKDKLGEMEKTLEGFQRTMHLVLSEVDADRERSATIAVRTTRFRGCSAFRREILGPRGVGALIVYPHPVKLSTLPSPPNYCMKNSPPSTPSHSHLCI